MKGNQKDRMEHIISLGDEIEVKLKIPYRLTAIELKALSMKANKLFQLAEVPMRKARAGKRDTWTGPMIEELNKLRKTGMKVEDIAAEINNKFGTAWTVQSVYGIVYRNKIN